MTTKVEKSIEVDVPVSTAYNQWTQFEEFPQFMGGVSEVTQLDDKTLHWVAEIAGVKREWDARILEQVPDHKVSWAATGGATNAGAVHFESLGATRTAVSLSLEYEPEGIVEKVGDRLNIIEKQATSDLEKFKSFIESRGAESGSWRGNVDDHAGVGTPGVEHASSSEGDSGKSGLSGKAVAAGLAAAAAVGVAAVAAKSGSSEDKQEVPDITPVAVPVVTETPIAMETPMPAPTSYTTPSEVDLPPATGLDDDVSLRSDAVVDPGYPADDVERAGEDVRRDPRI